MTNPVIETLLNHKSVRKYTDERPGTDVIETVVRAGQQAPFASQLYSIILSRKKKYAFGAPVMFTICVDLHKLELFMKKRGWRIVSNDLSLLVFGIQDAALVAQNMVVAGESMGLGSCLLGGTPYTADKLIQRFKLPKGVFPLVQLVMGYPAEDRPTRPRYPMDFVLFEDEYPEITDEVLTRAMQEMDEGYLAQDYYRNLNVKIPLSGDREETFTFEDYSWTEHISRKWGQWLEDPEELLEQLRKCGFRVGEVD